MKDRNNRVRTFEQLNQGQITDSSMTPRAKVELETDGQEVHTVIVSRLKRYSLVNGGQSFFWIAVYEKEVDDTDRFDDFYEVVDAVLDVDVDREITETEPKQQTGICQRIANFFS